MKHWNRRGSGTAALIAAVIVVSGCVVHTERTEGEEEATPTQPVAPQQVVIVVPVPSATPVPAPVVPAPTVPAPQHPSAPGGTLPPGATPDPSDVTVYCSVWVPPGNWNCPKNPNPRYGGAMSNAITRLQAEQPQIFQGAFVRDAVAYYNGVFKNLHEAGYCAIVDTNEVAVAQMGNNNYRENYHILSSAGNVRLQAHISACSR
jgi:hypothetical protein